MSSDNKQRFVALQYRDYRLIWIGQLLSTIGTQMQNVAVSWHVFELLQDQTVTLQMFGREFTLGADALGLGGLGLARVIPIVIFALFGGLLADAWDRRRIMIVSAVVSAVLAIWLGIATMSGTDSMLMIYFITSAIAAASAFDNPSRQSIVPNLVARKHLANAVSLNTLTWQIASIMGPGLAGFLISRLNVGVVYMINGVSFGAVILSLLLMQFRGQILVESKGLGVSALLDGVRFCLKERLIWSTMMLDFFATLFSGARTMLPIISTDLLGLDVTGYGILATAQPLGAVVAGVVMSWRSQIHRQGLTLLGGVLVYGVATILLGTSTVAVLSFVFLALVGAGDTVSTVIRGTLRQLVTPDELRGRMVSVNMVFFMGGPQLGELEAGLVAAAFGVPMALITGGIGTVLVTLFIAWRYPRLRNYTGEMLPAD
ncbi:MAG: MFS transporter [Anaerolineales bacterium]|nr:MFS transporter [Anaerolineales bacterium]MCB0007129.1 MFS transporter [Anaerolineales bacterium]MCB0010593.1 MFS transporter [Anaerolineales bacterium]MCB0030943.1 MFS transporter [Anaerolineales bacterium]MCB8959245.1 MFS transporter [Ardenticatenales bacterium]